MGPIFVSLEPPLETVFSTPKKPIWCSGSTNEKPALQSDGAICGKTGVGGVERVIPAHPPTYPTIPTTA
jgi:hypothetical protein